MEIKPYLLNYIKNAGKGGGILPTGTINITENGTVDVTNYATADVNVQATSTNYISDCSSLCANNFRISELSTLIPLCKPTKADYMFSNSSELTSFDGSNLDMLNCTTVIQMFAGAGITTISNLDTSNVTTTNFWRMFRNCNSLVNVSVMNTSKATRMQDMFAGCSSLSNDSLNNILEMCLNSNTYSAYKALSDIGLSSAQATTCTTLSNWQACVNAGWTTGY